MAYAPDTIHGLIPLTPDGWPKDEPLLLAKDVEPLLDELDRARARVGLLEAVVNEASAHIAGLLRIDTARPGARAWLRELPARTGLRSLYQDRSDD